MNQSFLNNYSLDDQELLKAYFDDLNSRIKLSKTDSKLFIEDFEKAFDFYHKNKEVSEIIKILSLDNLGTCYKDNPTKWYPLDNSAKIYPLSMKEKWMSVYRVSYYLNEEIVPEIMQIALTFTMKRFPTFRTSVRRGFFWHYIDEIKKRFSVEEESNVPCSYMNISKLGRQSFKVLYYKNRISLEIFHVLADGYGSITFLSTLLATYLKLLGREVNYNDIVLDINDHAKECELRDEFISQKVVSKKGSLVDSKALVIDGKLSNIKPCQVIHFDLDATKLKDLAHQNKAKVNELVLSFIFLVLSYSTSKDGYIKIQVPVNMRKYYESKTLRNFSLYNNISIKKSEITSLEKVIKEVKKQSQEKLSKNKLNEVMLYSSKLVKSLRWIPLFIKRPIARFIYGFVGEKSQTTVLSNMGAIKLPDKVSKNIKSSSFVLGTVMSNKVLFSMITVNNVATITISKFTTNSAVENNFYNILDKNNLILNVHGSEIYENRK